MWPGTITKNINKQMMRSTFIAVLGIVICIGCSSGTDQRAESEAPKMLFPDNGGLDLNTGFQATVVADSTYNNARHIVVNDNGDIYVKFRSSKINGVMALRDSDNDGRADEKQMFSTLVGTGIDIYNGYLYASTKSEVYRYKLMEGSLLPDDGRPLSQLPGDAGPGGLGQVWRGGRGGA